MQKELMAKVFLGLGGNIGDVKQTLKDAIVCLAQNPHIKVINRSCFYQSSPLDAQGDDFINNVVGIRTDLSPENLLKVCQTIEYEFGRERPYKNAPRTLDIDILIYDELQKNTQELTLPHPRLGDRLFVLVPLLELEPHIVIHPWGPLKNLPDQLSSQKITKMPGCQCPKMGL